MFTALLTLTLVTTAAPETSRADIAASPPASAAHHPGEQASLALAERFAALALACVHEEYPNKIAHVLQSDVDVQPPRELTPAFFGCYDWHSAVHGHWLLARLMRLHPDAPFAADARAVLARSLTPENMAIEGHYLLGEGRVSFERPYGLAWLLQLAAELAQSDSPQARTWSAALAPLEEAAAGRLADWLPKLTRPIRTGEHSQTAFAFGLMLDWARTSGRTELADLVERRAREFYADDESCPLTYEPSGQDFLSPCLAEADLMRRILAPQAYARWLRRFLPGLPAGGTTDWLAPALVSDRSDPKLAHLDGLNLSRAWMLVGMAAGLPAGDPLRVALRSVASRHARAGLEAVTGEHYEGGHWLGTFAVYLVTQRGIDPPEAPPEAPPEDQPTNQLKNQLKDQPKAATSHAALSSPREALEKLVAEVWEHQLRADPLLASQVGDHRYDDLLPDVSPEAERGRAEALEGFLLRLRNIERDRLPRAGQMNHTVLQRQLEDVLAEHRHRAFLIPITNRDGFHVALARLPDRLVVHDVQDAEAYLTRLKGIGAHTRQQIANLRRGLAEGYTLPQVVLTGVDSSIRAHIKSDPAETVFFAPFKKLPDTMDAADQTRLTDAARKTIREHVVPAYEAFLAFMTEEYIPGARTTVGASSLPDGRHFYAQRVRHFTTLDVTAEQVHQIGLDEVARLRGEMEAVIKKVGFDGDWAAFFKHLRTAPRFYARTPEQLLQQASWIAKRMEGELPRLFGKLPRMPFGIRPVPDFIAPKTSAAYYNRPGGDGRKAGTYFVNTYDLDSRPLYTFTALSLHEAVPGHHLQIALQQELDDVPPLRRFSGFGAFVEGWALYAERLGLEAGLYDDPYDDFGRLTFEIWRACRLVVDTGLHALGWTRQQAINYMADNTALSLHDVTTEIDRYIAWPGQALGYKMGELKITALRRKAEKDLGDQFDLRAFHDVVLGSGALPLNLLEEEVELWLAQQRLSAGGETGVR